jgi:hypothetical protein
LVLRKTEEKENIINQICWDSGNLFSNWNGSSPWKSNKWGFYPKHMAGNDYYPIYYLGACLGTEFLSHIWVAHQIKYFQKYLLCRKKNASGFPEGYLEMCLTDKPHRHKKASLTTRASEKCIPSFHSLNKSV